MAKVLQSLLIVLFLSLPNLLFAKNFIPNGPLIARTDNPIYLQSLGQMPTPAKVLAKDRYRTWLDLSYTNMFERGRHGTNEVYLDMELARIAVNGHWGIGSNMEVGLQIPFLHFNGGYFDAFIQDFHKAFGFPNGGRNKVPNGQYKYQVTRSGTVIYNVGKMGIGLSDIIFDFKHKVLDEDRLRPAVSWTFRFKFPTGKPSTGLGSGNVDYSFGAVLEKSISRWHFYGNFDYIVASGNDALDGLYYNQLFAWLLSVEFSVAQPISIIVQMQGSSPLLKGLGTNRWDGYPVDLVIGVKGTHKDLFWGSDLFWQWGFTEDLAAEGPSPDVTTMLILGVEF